MHNNQKEKFLVFKTRSQKVYLLVLPEVSEANKRELVAHKRFGWREGLGVAFVIIYVVKVAGVDVAAQLWHDWSHSWGEETERQGGGQRAMMVYKETWSRRYFNLENVRSRHLFFQDIRG